jgi:hypothetical protein
LIFLSPSSYYLISLQIDDMPTFTKAQIKEIAEELENGFRAFYHKETNELLFVPDTMKYSGADLEEWTDDLDKLDENFLDYQEIDAMQSSDSFQIMADFTEQVKDTKLRSQLERALGQPKPFKMFRFVIDDEDEERDRWFAFKNKSYIEWVERQIRTHNQ